MPKFLERNFLKYTVIFGEGSRGDSAFLLKQGRVEISKTVDGKKKVLAILKPVSLFGEMAVLLGDERRTATAIAMDDCKTVEIQRFDFEDSIKASPPIIGTVLQVLVHRLKTATQKAMRAPNFFLGTCNTLALMADSGVKKVDYMKLLSSLAATMVATEDEIKQALETLSGDGMIRIVSVDGKKEVEIIEQENFTSEAVKRRKAAYE
jgi:CRP-like cAMP-binding protein